MGSKRTKFFTISELARARDIPPRIISDLFYQRVLDDTACPLANQRMRLIPENYVGEIDRVLRERGLIAEAANV